MPLIFIYPIAPAIILGTLNWLYWKRQGYTSKVQWAMNILLFYLGFYLLFSKIL